MACCDGEWRGSDSVKWRDNGNRGIVKHYNASYPPWPASADKTLAEADAAPGAPSVLAAKTNHRHLPLALLHNRQL